MSILKRGADMIYTFRFIRLLVLDWKNWDAYKLGIIDEKGKRLKSQELDTDARKSAYTPFIRLTANVKRLLGKVPGLGSGLGSFAAGLFLIKEKYGLSDDNLSKIMSEFGIEPTDLLSEDAEWFVLKNGELSPGVYRIKNTKVLNSTLEEMVLAKDQIKVFDGKAIGDVFGISVYEATHLKTNQKIYITSSEIYK
jgi:hypothetical protein|tara:strand:+ start:547 stop:1131 length:585 start_codon:yes stop_codon:yes gene_type:complete